MHAMFIRGLDFDAIKKEIKEQASSSVDRAWLAFFYVGLEELKDKYGLLIPYFDEFYDLACQDIVQKAILNALAEPKSRKELMASIKYPSRDVERELKGMIKNAQVIEEDGKFKRKDSKAR